MIQGIPYFGETTQEIYEYIQSEEYINTEPKEITYNSLYELIISNIGKRIIVVIDNKWLTWLTDIIFDYRDRLCYIPYYEYKQFVIPERNFQSNNKGHLILNNKQVTLRYEYNYKKSFVDINNLCIDCVDVDTMDKMRLNTNTWIDKTEFNIEKLYNLYLNSCYPDDDFRINKHIGGYHYITKETEGFRNRERSLRKEYELFAYNPNSSYDSDYRDVRQYKYNEVISKSGFIANDEVYKFRRLRFEAYLYCILRQHCLDNIHFNNRIYKVGNGIKLIIKDYWLDNKEKPYKTYIK